MSKLKRFDEVLEAIDNLPPEDQENLIAIVERRWIAQQRSKRRRAVMFIFLGSLVIGIAVVNIAQGSKGWVTDASRFSFMAFLFVCGIVGCWFGWKQLRKLKEQTPELSWWQFLRTELIFLMILFFLALGIGVLPEEKRQDLINFLHNMNIAIHGHP